MERVEIEIDDGRRLSVFVPDQDRYRFNMMTEKVKSGSYKWRTEKPPSTINNSIISKSLAIKEIRI